MCAKNDGYAPMIVLVQPMYSKQELNADSNYVVYTSLIRGMRRVRPEWHFVVIFPDAKSGFKYEDDGFFREPNVTRVPQRISTRKMANAVSYDAIWYDTLFRAIGIDVVWCNLVEIAAHLNNAGEGAFDPVARPFVVAAHNYVIHHTLTSTWDSMQHVALAQVLGSVGATWNVYNSEHCRQMYVDTASRWLRTDVVESVLARSSLINYGTLEMTLTPDPQRPPNPVPVIAYNHRLQGYKQYRETFTLLDELHREGVPFRVRYMNNTAEQVAQIAHYPFVEVKLCATRREYLDALRGCDLNVTNSVHETFCIAAIESMALGQPLVAPAGVTFPEITGRRETDYPYLFCTRDEQKAMLRRLLTDAAERQRWGVTLSEYVRRQYNQTLWAQRYAALFETLAAERQPNVAPDALAFFRDTLRAHNGATARDLYREVSHKDVNGRAPFSSQSLTLTKLVKMVRQLGGRVAMVSGEQRCYAS